MNVQNDLRLNGFFVSVQTARFPVLQSQSRKSQFEVSQETGGKGMLWAMQIGEVTLNPSSDSGTRCEVCPLSRVQTGVAVRIKQLCAAPEIQNRLREIGLGEDQVVRLITSRNNFICQVCNSRLAISEQLARVILVEPLLQPARI